MTLEEIVKFVDEHPSSKLKLAVTDIDGILRGKYISSDKFKGLSDLELSFCDVVFGWDMHDAVYDQVSTTNLDTGYPDAPIKLDLKTFRTIPWEDDVPFLLGDFYDDKGEPSPICPRQLLKKVIDQCDSLGFKPFCAQEFEWFNFEETPSTFADKNYRDPKVLTPGMFGYSILRSTLKKDYISDLFSLLKAFDIPLEGLHTETGPGVYEAAITYSDALEAADRATLFKTAVKEIAYKHGIMATFMAKWDENLPGCSGHVHQSLWDKAGKVNLFYEEESSDKMSPLMKNYLAGQLHCLPHILPLLAPTINSYKRLVEGAWAPTTLTWAVDNRTVAVRILPTGKKSTRIETRVVGSDTNPYLAIAACLASGLYGIRHQLPLEQPKTLGNGYKDKSNGTLPSNLYEANQQMKNSPIAQELFGNKFVEHFCATRDWEWQQFAQHVTDWELKRYFEII
ncbi:glutamine synthetase family protein [Sphingobacterium chungjuense]|uniref:glutamine synthetase family protein n=1 Tax=Sphingobacterium chungjuense TaxID=2675553 RepID=UPI00140CA413|nr:glutamine synthetase family protein [Sphingobacterium chungjuense]